MFTKQIKSSSNSFFMNLALMQAHKSLGNTKNNPAVGCVIINNNSVISVGNTGFNGRPHAEQNAILLSKSSVKIPEMESRLHDMEKKYNNMKMDTERAYSLLKRDIEIEDSNKKWWGYLKRISDNNK